jgi:hypothetical protein
MRNKDKISISVAILAIIVSITIPEIRIYLGLDKKTIIEEENTLKGEGRHHNKKESITEGVLRDSAKNVESIQEIDKSIITNIDTFRVRNIYDLVRRIGSNTVIYIEKGNYDLTKIPKHNNKHIELSENGSVVFKNLDNLFLKGIGSEVEVFTSKYEVDVLNFKQVNRISLENINFGHSKSVSSCSIDADVLEFNYSDDIRINNCELWGTGFVGLVLRNSRNIRIDNSRIYDCSSSAVLLNDSEDVIIKATYIENNELHTVDENGWTLIDIRGKSSIVFDNSNFRKNKAHQLIRFGDPLSDNDTSDKFVSFINTTFYMNDIYKRPEENEFTLFEDCTFDFNQFGDD